MQARNENTDSIDSIPLWDGGVALQGALRQVNQQELVINVRHPSWKENLPTFLQGRADQQARVEWPHHITSLIINWNPRPHQRGEGNSALSGYE
jgi:hypothetical protein